MNAPVSDAVPLARRKPGAAAYVWVGVAIFAVVVFLHVFEVIAGPGSRPGSSRC